MIIMRLNARMIIIFWACSGSWCVCQCMRSALHMLAATSDGSRLSELGPSMQIGWYFANASIAAAPETIVVLVGMLITSKHSSHSQGSLQAGPAPRCGTRGHNTHVHTRQQPQGCRTESLAVWSPSRGLERAALLVDVGVSSDFLSDVGTAADVPEQP